MSNYPFFLESELGRSEEEKCLFHIISAPLENSVSYGHGTRLGPEAIIEASQQLELFDGHGNPSSLGIYTHPPLDLEAGMENSLALIEAKVLEVAEKGKMPVILGGEHSVTNGVLRGLRKVYPDFGVIQFDAHADLRDSYEGSPLSHACVMRRVFDMGLPFFQIGIRSHSLEEAEFIRENRLTIIHPGESRSKKDTFTEALENLPSRVFITFDVDGWDPAIMPSTGTPEPGGLDWFESLHYLEAVFHIKEVIGFDMVELAPVKEFHAPDFMTARMIYQMMGMKQRSRY